MLWFIGFYVLSIFALQRTFSVRITDLKVPMRAQHEALLDCRYDLEGDQLYDVKWFKDNQQFLQCIPGKVHEYHVDGIHIYSDSVPSIGSCPVLLMNLTPKSDGEYRCEVTGEGPTFRLHFKTARLKVIMEPVERNENTLTDREDDEDSTPKSGGKESNTTWNAYSSKGERLALNNYVAMFKGIFILFIVFCCRNFYIVQ